MRNHCSSCCEGKATNAGNFNNGTYRSHWDCVASKHLNFEWAKECARCATTNPNKNVDAAEDVFVAMVTQVTPLERLQDLVTKMIHFLQSWLVTLEMNI